MDTIMMAPPKDCSVYVRRMHEKNISPMPFIGLYVAAASTLCSIAMLLNSNVAFYNSLSDLNLHLSGNFFALNATWLTLLAVATKLTADLTTPMLSFEDNLTKISGTVFFVLAMGNAFTSLGSKNDKDILNNITALSILVITSLVDLCIQLSTGALDFWLFPEIIYAIVFLCFMIITLVCSALAVPAIKKRADSKYQKLGKQMESGQQRHPHTVEELRLSISKYWVMAVSGSPRFLMERLVTFVFMSIICMFSSLVSFLGLRRYAYKFCDKLSDYKWSVYLILLSQYFAALQSLTVVIILLIGVVGYKYEDNGIKISIEEFTIESYWTEKLVEWRHSPIPMRFKRRAVRKLLHNVKALVLTLFIQLQSAIIIWCKFCYVLAFYTMLPLAFLVNLLGRLVNHYLGNFFYKNEVSNDPAGILEIHLNSFVILLEGEKQLPKELLRKIISKGNKNVGMGRMQRPQNLINLLHQSFSFSGVVEFDSNLVPSLLSSEEPPNCWTLPVVTLASIIIALPNIASQHVDWLVSSVDEGLRYASLIDVLDDKCGSKNIKNAADVVWVGVELHKKWFDIDLGRLSREVNSAKEIIQVLANEAEKTVMKFSSIENKILVENPLFWPANVLAANSMYRISRTILLSHQNVEYEAEDLFKKLSCTIADILVACLINLPHLIATKYKCNTIEERENNVRDAAILLGETEDILRHFEECQLSSPSQPLFIDEWRRWMEREDPTVSASATSNEDVVVQVYL
ncbi:PREDICTED: uncharacterized protein LOC109168601 [Ipomoea nil]|uniref:uncharacterized protein LOC109168601 n=1 Tax=Ipomoea nil TaxID=35883 RepID=UPI0009012855|nr:PREDICTED: uncharacterized protein LOC109168601 [Ipomoea nil]